MEAVAVASLESCLGFVSNAPGDISPAPSPFGWERDGDDSEGALCHDIELW